MNMGRDKDEEWISNSMAPRYASEIFRSAGNGNLTELKRALGSATKLSTSGRVRAGHNPSFSNNGPASPPLSRCVLLFYLRDKKSSTPLHYAAGNGHLEACRFLLNTVFAAKAKAEAENSPPRDSKLSATAAARSYANTPNKTQGRTALHWAARNGHLSVCKLLVEDYGADPDPLAKGDVTPLQLAVWRGHLEVCRWLSETAGSASKHNNKQHFMNGWGCTVHHWLAKSPIYAEEKQQEKQHKEQQEQKPLLSQNETRGVDIGIGIGIGIDSIVSTVTTTNAETKLLALCKWLDEGEDCDKRLSKSHPVRSAWSRPNDHGQTPLHKAGFGGNMPVLRFLIETKGCHDTHRDSQHNTAADCAERNRQWEAARYLRRHGSPQCLQTARAVLFPFPECESEEQKRKTTREPPLPRTIRSAYLRLARLYHPDRAVETHPRCSNSNNNNNKNNKKDIRHEENALKKNRRWKDLQEAYQLWTVWWKDPDEADAMIRSLERHRFLQRQLPLLILWHQKWHESVRQEIENNRPSGNHRIGGNNNSESTAGEGAGKANHGEIKRVFPKNSRKQKTDRELHGNNNNHRLPPLQKRFSEEAIQKLEDFERKLVRLLGTLPSQEIPLSQLPKEYEKTWGGSTSNNNNSNGINAMIRPRDYRCKKLGFLLETHCHRTVEVVQKAKVDVSEKEKAGATIVWVRLKDGS